MRWWAVEVCPSCTYARWQLRTAAGSLTAHAAPSEATIVSSSELHPVTQLYFRVLAHVHAPDLTGAWLVKLRRVVLPTHMRLPLAGPPASPYPDTTC